MLLLVAGFGRGVVPGPDWIRSHDLLRIEITPGMWRIRLEVVFWYTTRKSMKCHTA